MFLTPLRLTAVASAANAGIHKKILGSGSHHSSSSALHNNNYSSIMLRISNNGMEDNIKIVKSLKTLVDY